MNSYLVRHLSKGSVILTVLALCCLISPDAYSVNDTQKIRLARLAESLIGKTVLDLPVYAGVPPYPEKSLSEVTRFGTDGAILAVIDRNLAENHAQQAVFERFSRKYQQTKMHFPILYLAQKPRAYLEYLCPSRPSPCPQYAMKRSLFMEQIGDPEDKALILLIDRNNRIVKCLVSYTGYEHLSHGMEFLLESMLKGEGEAP